MQIESWEDFRREMAMTCEAYDRKHTKELDDAYWSALSKMQLKDFKRASLFAREKAGQESYDRLPKPGKFWAFLDEIRRSEKPREQVQAQSGSLTHEQHLIFMRRKGIECAKMESMPHFKGSVQRIVPDIFQSEYDAKWKAWDDTLGQMDDDYWWPRAQELIAQWSSHELRPKKPQDIADALKRIA